MNFASTLVHHGIDALKRSSVETVQINLGKVCNQACHHCHVSAGPKRTESMTVNTAERVLELIRHTPDVQTVDITGGAPELNPNFRTLVEESRRLDKKVIDRCNLTVLLEPGFDDMPAFLADQRVEITASLPCYTGRNVDSQRGRGVFDKSVRALQLLNRAGFGLPGSDLRLNLIFNPGGPSLPPPQDTLEFDYKSHLREEFGIEFNRLLTLTNMPVGRFSESLVRIGKEDEYLHLLQCNFNAATVDYLMCRTMVSVSWDGYLYDCDFNQMLEIPSAGRPSLWDVDSFESVIQRPIQVADHCFGCTAGAGSSCGGRLSNNRENTHAC
jgi:radical SAM/Cys-rich protein